jgi:hypothetical protein
MLDPTGGRGLVLYTFDLGVDGSVDGRAITSPRPVNAPDCGVVPSEREG